MEKLTEMQEAVLTALRREPMSFGALVQRLGGNDVYRKVDSALQALRRRGLVRYERGGRVPMWRPIP